MIDAGQAAEILGIQYGAVLVFVIIIIENHFCYWKLAILNAGNRHLFELANEICRRIAWLYQGSEGGRMGLFACERACLGACSEPQP
ncbi:protein of unknown function [Methylorubrum extorquens]|uniref:Uncharacterized protein n=1 Tax=Methylorubrum extorquens TaxID=408 RepID=A0A2N9AU06_METEX|nr:protein of unknown function [Methylorubrum extorquens]